MSAIMTDNELAAALAEWAKHRGPMPLAWKLADHVAATHGAKAEPQPVAVPQCVKDWAKRTRCGQREWNWILQDDTEATVAWIESLDSPTVDAVAPSDDATQSQPQPVPVSPLALWIADRTFTACLEYVKIGMAQKADTVSALVAEVITASIAAAARIEGGTDVVK